MAVRPYTASSLLKNEFFNKLLAGQRIVMLHGFIKKSEKTPPKELKIARTLLAEVTKL